MEHIKSAQQQMRVLEAALDKAMSSGGNAEALQAAQAAMKSLEVQLSQATAAMGLSDAASTTDGAMTPGTSVADGHSNGASGPDLAVKPHANGPPKLSLQQRKNIRDEFQNKTEDYAKSISELMKQTWTVHVDTVNVLSYSDEGSTRDNPGGMFDNFFSGAVDGLGRWLKKTGADGRDALNHAAFHHVMTLEPAEGADAPTTACDIRGGKLRLTFRQDALGWNTSGCLADDNLSVALNAVDVADGAGLQKPDKLPFATRLNVRDEYENKIGPVLESARASLQRPDLKFTPNFASNFAFMKKWMAANEERASSISDNWEAFWGARTFDYFDGFATFLKRKKFADDDMLREGFFDACDQADVQMRVVDKNQMKGSNSSETCIENGVCYLQTTPDGWGWSTSNAAENLLDVL